VAQPIDLIVGLGNPGPRYERTRHNVGFWLVERICRMFGRGFRTESRFSGEVCEARMDGRGLRLLKPRTFMNRSGQSVGAAARYYRIAPARILVVHDDVDLPPGVLRLKEGGGHAGHNGLRDIISHLGSADFVRLRIGVGHPGRKDDVHDYVLDAPDREQARLLEDALAQAMEYLDDIVAGEHARVMNALHRKRRARDGEGGGAGEDTSGD